MYCCAEAVIAPEPKIKIAENIFLVTFDILIPNFVRQFVGRELTTDKVDNTD